MSKLAYGVSFLEGQTVTGLAKKLFVKDENTVLTISENHAPLIATLTHGFVEVFNLSGEPAKYVFQQAFLNCHDNAVTITVIQ